ncbi:hypothetical protein F0U60_31240 [Archangium minus]|uniref:Uncharacterized protein n=1 Tax=Archangium minus TaxID=83450 RepID=A0ABY9WYA8_9BACT|nr:hypothetical protein F0U60_31240 [Archangium minus]
MNVVFTGWLNGVRTVSLVHLLKEKAGLSLSEAKAIVDALVDLPVARLKMSDARAASRIATALELMGLPCSRTGATLTLTGWRPGVEERVVIDLIASEVELPLPQIVEFAKKATAGSSVKVACPAASLAQELASEARICGAICHVAP